MFVAHELVAACGGRLAPRAAGLFEWWRVAPSAHHRGRRGPLPAPRLADSRRNAWHCSPATRSARCTHALLPKAIRHTLGAYLSPPDLARTARRHRGGPAPRHTGRAPRRTEPRVGRLLLALLARGCPREHLGCTFARQVFGVEKNLGPRRRPSLHAAIVAEQAAGGPSNVVWADPARSTRRLSAAVLGTDQPEGGRVLVPGSLKVTLPADRDLARSPTPARCSKPSTACRGGMDRPLRAWLRRAAAPDARAAAGRRSTVRPGWNRWGPSSSPGNRPGSTGTWTRPTSALICCWAAAGPVREGRATRAFAGRT